MSDFEKWFVGQDFYTNMRFIHGDKLFDKDGDVYRVLPVQMVYQGWSVQRQRSKDEFMALTQEWHTKGWNNRQEEVDVLKAEIKKLGNLVGQAECDIDTYQEGISELKTQLAVYKEDMQRDAEKIAGLQKRVDEYEKLTSSIRNEFNLWTDGREFSDVIEAQIENLEALRGGHENN